MDKDIVSRRFGPKFEKPCKNQGTVGCALYKCQAANECQSCVTKAPSLPMDNLTAESAAVPYEWPSEALSIDAPWVWPHETKETLRKLEPYIQSRIAAAVKSARVEALEEVFIALPETGSYLDEDAQYACGDCRDVVRAFITAAENQGGKDDVGN
jgi:hypothetical protein